MSRVIAAIIAGMMMAWFGAAEATVKVPSTASAMQTIRPHATKDALVNPGMGWVFYKYSNRLWCYGTHTASGDTLDWFPGCSTIYFRVLWNDIESVEGERRWDIFDSFAQNWIAKGKKIAIRIICTSQVEDATPKWVREAGAKGWLFDYTWHGMNIKDRWEPVYDDVVFLEKLEAFIKDFARRYDGDPNVAFVDIGTMGLFGEGHSRSVRKQNERRRYAKIHIDLWRKHMQKTYLVISDDVDGALNPEEDVPLMEYCRSIGVGFRDDSIFTFPKKGKKYRRKDGTVVHADSWLHDGWGRKFAPLSPVVLETCHAYYRMSTGQWKEEKYLEAVEKYQASYMSIHDFPELHLKDCRESIDKINLRLGYRFELREAVFPNKVKLGEAVEIASKWCNVGVSWCHNGASLTWALIDKDGNVAWSVTDSKFDFRSLDPKLDGVEKPKKVMTKCRFGYTKRVIEPDNCVKWAKMMNRDPGEETVLLKPGEYDLAVSVGSRQGTPEIALPIAGGKNRRYILGKIKVCASE